MKCNISILMLSLAFSVVTFAQQASNQVATNHTEGKEATFHGMTMGRTLRSQLESCETRRNLNASDGSDIVDGAVSEVCFANDRVPHHVTTLRADANYDYLDFDGNPSDPKHKFTVVVNVQPGSEKISSDGTVESVWAEYKMEEASNILAILKDEYGQQPACETSTLDAGAEIPVEASRCLWKLPWGVVSFYAPWTTSEILRVSASTTKYLEYLAEQQRTESTKNASEF